MTNYNGATSLGQNTYTTIGRSNKYENNTKRLDENFAIDIYDFINGNINLLPRKERLNKLINSCIERQTIYVSQALGVTVILEEKQDETYDIVIEIETAIRNTKTRYDKLTCDNHDVYLNSDTPKRHSLTELKNIPTGDKRLIDFPVFDKGRFMFLQKYLNEYFKEFGPIEFNKNKNKVIQLSLNQKKVIK